MHYSKFGESYFEPFKLFQIRISLGNCVCHTTECLNGYYFVLCLRLLGDMWNTGSGSVDTAQEWLRMLILCLETKGAVTFPQQVRPFTNCSTVFIVCNTWPPIQSNKSFAFLWTSLWFPPPHFTCIVPIKKFPKSFFFNPCSYLASKCCSKIFFRHHFLTSSMFRFYIFAVRFLRNRETNFNNLYFHMFILQFFNVIFIQYTSKTLLRLTCPKYHLLPIPLLILNTSIICILFRNSFKRGIYALQGTLNKMCIIYPHLPFSFFVQTSLKYNIYTEKCANLRQTVDKFSK